jgi:hypothetical protein
MMPSSIQFDRNKLKAAILRICASCPPERLGAVKLHKVLYFADMISFALSGRAVTGAEYRKRPFGPTCVPLLPVLREMENDGQLIIREDEYFGLTKKTYQPLVQADDNRLSKDEGDLLEAVIDFVCNQNTARSISEISHQLPWELAEFGETISYDTALLLFPSQPSPDAVEKVNKEAGALEAARSNYNAVGHSTYRDFRGRVLSHLRSV